LTFEPESTVAFDNQGAVTKAAKVGKGLYFDGRNFVKIDKELPAKDSPRTFAVWLKTSRQGGHIISYGTNGNNEPFGIMISGGKWRFYDNGGGLSSGIKVDSDWHHHCFVYDGKELKYFLDGQPVSKVERKLATKPLPLVIGISPALGAYGEGMYEGLVDELVVYNRPLTSEQVQRLFELGEQGKHPSP
jgi:hypothetical protein